jgi:hypothetical protein
MPRYFETFFVDEPMIERSETEARELASYVVEAPVGATPRLEVWLHGELERVIYPEARPGPDVAELQRTRDTAVPTWITSPVMRDADMARYTIWHYHPGGQLQHRTDYLSTPLRTESTWYDAEGRLGGARERHYSEDGEQLQVIEITPDGRRMVVKT